MRYLHTLAVAAVLFAACSDRPSAPTAPAFPGIRGYNEISSGSGWVRAELDDYPPGAVVTILGGGWEPGETVIMILTEDPDVQQDLVLTSVADESGGFANSDFSTTELHLGVTFTLSAEGQSSGMTASTMFDDGAPTVNSFKLNGTTFTFPAPPPPNQDATNPVTVASGAMVTLDVNATTVASGGPNPNATWKSTLVQFQGGTIEYGDPTDYCDDTDVVATSGVTTEDHSFMFSAPSAAETYDVRVRAFEGNGCSGQSGQLSYNGVLIVTAVTNHAPTSDAGGPYEGDEGAAIALDGTAEDEDDDELTTSWTYEVVSADAGASCSFDDDSEVDTNVTCTDDGTYTLTLTVDDGTADPVADTATLTVNNADPSIDAVTDPDDNPLSSSFTVGGTVELKVTFSDAGENDTHKAQIDCANGSGYQDVDGSGEDTSPFEASCTFATVGPKTVKVKITDDDGGFDEWTKVFSVLYDFDGFYRPVDNDDILNVAKAGQAIPLKWRLLDALGNPVLTLSAVSVKVESLACSLGESSDQLEEYASGASGLQNLGDGYYQFNWKTPSSYAKSCKTMKLDLGEGAGNEHVALFQFTK